MSVTCFWDRTLCDKVCQWLASKIEHYVIKFVSDLRQVGVFSTIKIDRMIYNWTIVYGGVKHHNPNPFMFLYITKVCIVFSIYLCMGHSFFYVWNLIYWMISLSTVSTLKNKFYFLWLNTQHTRHNNPIKIIMW